MSSAASSTYNSLRGGPSVAATPAVLMVGPWRDAEFARVLACLDGHDRWREVAHFPEAISAINSGEAPPDIVLIADGRPGVHRSRDVEAFRQLAPLAPMVVVAGTWCEGELRTGHPLEGVVRIYWYEAAAWWRAALARWQAGLCPPWSEPLSDLRAGHSVLLRDEISTPAHLGFQGYRALISTRDDESFAALSTGLRAAAGWQCERHRSRGQPNALTSGEAPSIAIWDGAMFDADELARLSEFATEMKELGAAVLALIDFPRREHLETVVVAGADAILGKPYQVSLLATELERIRRCQG